MNSSHLKHKTLIAICFTCLLIGCNYSPKKMLSNANEWVINMPDQRIESQPLALCFSEDTLTTLSENNRYNIKWLDKQSFSIEMNGNNAIVNLKKISKDQLEAAFLYQDESIPKSDEDWQMLQKENRIIYINKYFVPKKAERFYKSGGKSIPIDKVPPAGLYVYDNTLIKVIIIDDNVNFQCGDNNSLQDDKDATIDDNGQITLSDYPSCWYKGNGIIEMLGYYFFGNTSDENVEFKLQSQSDEANTDELNSDEVLSELINEAITYGFIYNNKEKFGKIVKLTIESAPPHSGYGLELLNVPDGKMWIPLYFEPINGSHTLATMEIFNKTNSGFGYRNYYEFDVTKNLFVSAKYSKQNNRAIVGRGEVGVAISTNSWSRSVFNIYFLEESI